MIYMKPLILAAILTLITQPVKAEDVPQSVIDTYKPKTPMAQHMWQHLSDWGKQAVYSTEHNPTFTPMDYDSRIEEAAVISYDINIYQNPNSSAAQNVDMQSYQRGFKDAWDLAKQDPPQKTSSLKDKIRQASRNLGAVLGSNFNPGVASVAPYWASNVAPYCQPLIQPAAPTYIQRVTPYNSPFPMWQVY
jgi:hypothetical protein